MYLGLPKRLVNYGVSKGGGGWEETQPGLLVALVEITGLIMSAVIETIALHRLHESHCAGINVVIIFAPN